MFKILMLIQSIPIEFQPFYKSVYPSYSNGENMEEICYNFLDINKHKFKTDRIYLPVFWTSYYVTHNYGKNIQNLLHWLNTLDRTKKYFTIVQYANGILGEFNNIDLLVFSAGGGGINNSCSEKIENFYGLERYVFIGNKGDYDIPLLCKPSLSFIDTNSNKQNLKKDIYCSFMGRFDTHRCRMIMKEKLQNNKLFSFHESSSFEDYNNILNKSIFSLTPRGYGYSSFRIYEAILANSIPVYIWDDKSILPFSEILNWEEFCVIIHEKDIDILPTILSKVDIPKFQAKIEQIKHMFSFEYIFEYIIDKISTKISLALPYYNNIEYIQEAINTAIYDSRINEIIIVDDKSDDIVQLETLLSNISSSKIKLFKNSNNLGCYHNKINTISKCTNEWTILLDSDNIIHKDYIDTLYEIENWEQNTIYLPSFARTFPGEESQMLNYKKFSGMYISKQFYIDNFQDINFQCLTNTCNYFLPTKEYHNLMISFQYIYERKFIDSLDSAVLFTDWLFANNKLFVVDKLEYKHRTHSSSNYVVSPARPYENMVKQMLLHKIINS